MELPVGLILEGLLAILLGVTVFYCVLLDRRLRNLRSGQDGMREVIANLNAATARAQASIGQLTVASQETGTQLRDVLTKGSAIRDELALMIETGNNLADRLEGASGAGGRAGQSAAVRGMRAGDTGAGRHRSGSERPRTDTAETVVGAGHPGLEDRLLKALRDAR